MNAYQIDFRSSDLKSMVVNDEEKRKLHVLNPQMRRIAHDKQRVRNGHYTRCKWVERQACAGVCAHKADTSWKKKRKIQRSAK